MLVALTADGVERRGAPVLVASFDHKTNNRITNIKMRFPAHDERDCASPRRIEGNTTPAAGRRPTIHASVITAEQTTAPAEASLLFLRENLKRRVRWMMMVEDV